jgi:mersacidin/lichenicidin family type 2 lantibiotic
MQHSHSRPVLLADDLGATECSGAAVVSGGGLALYSAGEKARCAFAETNERTITMKKIDIIRAWKDEDYRNSLSAEELAGLPENPAGMIELTDGDLGKATGGAPVISALVQCTEVTRRCDSPCVVFSC